MRCAVDQGDAPESAAGGIGLVSHVIPARVRRVVDWRDAMHDRKAGHYIGEGRNHHHRQLLSRGGEDWPSNIVTLSGSGTTGTHGWVHANPAEATRLGFMVPSWVADPAAVPIFLADSRGVQFWALLGDDGTTTPLTPDDAFARMRALGVWKG